MPPSSTRPPARWIGVGTLLGLAAAAGLRALALGSGAARVPDSWVNGLALGVAGAALVVSRLARPGSRGRRPRSGRAMAVTGGMLASLAVAAWVGLGNDVIRYHTADQFHYYVGGKYFRELGYSRIYACAAVAEAERVGLEAMEGRHMRDLATDRVVSVDAALATPAACRERFTADRWRAFGDDVMWFRGKLGRLWDRVQQDHGFNPPPTWVLAGGTLASLAPAGERTQTLLGLADPVLLGAMLALVGWAFGAHVLLVAVVVWACQLPGQATWTTAALLRQDWLLCLVAAVCLARRGWPACAGVTLASAAAIRVFPALLLALPLLLVVRRAWARGGVGRGDARFLVGVAAGAVAWFGLSTAVFGFDAWLAFRDHLALHRLAPLANHVGLRALLSQSWEGRWMAVMQPRADDPFAVWAAMRRATFAAHRILYLALASTIVAVAAVAGSRLHRLWVAMAASSVLVVTAVDLTSYYCAFFIVLGLLAAASRREERLALSAIVAGRALNFLPVATDHPDLCYTVQSAVFVAWGLAALVLAAWRPPWGHRGVAVAPRGARASRRRGAVR